ncbi:MAG: DUF1552 domain-containing protein [Polyangiaceae bacterium]|nr:DUF1552 domain-containing protein [Polyangiaceae bacterium]
MQRRNPRLESTRRSLLRGLAGAGLGWPLARLLDPRLSRAQAAAPQRLLVIDMPNCTWLPEWVPTGGRNVQQASGDAKAFQYGLSSSPLEAIRHYTTILNGIGIDRPGGDPHVASQIHFMSGDVDPSDTEGSFSPSVDQILAKDSPTLKAGQLVPSVTLSAHTTGESERTRIHIISFDHNLQPIQPQNSPYEAYRSLFSGVAAAPSPPGDAQAASAKLAQNKSVLDFVDASINSMIARAPAYEKQKLDAHLQGLRELEQRLLVTQNTSGVVLPDPATMQNLMLNSTEDHEKIINSFFSILKAGFALDLTRVGTFMFSSGHNWVDMKQSYLPNVSQSGNVHEVTHVDYQGKNLDMRLITGWYLDHLVGFVQSLANTPDIGGGTLLDNTLIVFFSEVAITGDGLNAQHDSRNIPLLMIGGQALGNEGGRCLQYSGHTTNDFWATVAPKLGVAMDRFGKPESNTGKLAELFIA